MAKQCSRRGSFYSAILKTSTHVDNCTFSRKAVSGRHAGDSPIKYGIGTPRERLAGCQKFKLVDVMPISRNEYELRFSITVLVADDFHSLKVGMIFVQSE